MALTCQIDSFENSLCNSPRRHLLVFTATGVTVVHSGSTGNLEDALCRPIVPRGSLAPYYGFGTVCVAKIAPEAYYL